MHGIMSGIAALDQLADPALRIIVEPDEAATTCEARMVEQREMVEAELERCVCEEDSKPRQVLARLRGLGEAVAQASHSSAHLPQERFAIICKAQAPSPDPAGLIPVKFLTKK
jgi:hypothetical protein